MGLLIKRHDRDTNLDLLKCTNQWLLNIDEQLAQNTECTLAFKYAAELKQLKVNTRITLHIMHK